MPGGKKGDLLCLRQPAAQGWAFCRERRGNGEGVHGAAERQGDQRLGGYRSLFRGNRRAAGLEQTGPRGNDQPPQMMNRFFNRTQARCLAALCSVILAAGCATEVGSFTPLAKIHPPKPSKSPVDVFTTGMPSRPFERV